MPFAPEHPSLRQQRATLRPPKAAIPSARNLLRRSSGQSLIEIAVCLPILVLLACYAVEFGYFFVAAASLSASARNAAVYATQGYASPIQGSASAVGSLTTPASVAGTAFGNMSGFLHASTSMAVQLCTNKNGTVTCSTAGSSDLILPSYQPDTDPESADFGLTRVDVVYSVSPPIPLKFFSVSLMPNLNFHRMAEMRVTD